MKNTVLKVLAIFVSVFLAIQFIRLDKTNPNTDKSKEIIASAEVKNILKKTGSGTQSSLFKLY